MDSGSGGDCRGSGNSIGRSVVHRGAGARVGSLPLLLTQNANELPFNLGALRWLEYRPDLGDLADLREHLTRAIRVFLLASKARPGDELSR